ncbi:mitochondrial cardiolipin hydrolase [Hyperolius riggenbachi]|uniref:mitochondrial cardiolipin hydrolase n=1 Tax=Hyperolius riggenbachi TaxID=752182 RepID=UPI0035A26245
MARLAVWRGLLGAAGLLLALEGVFRYWRRRRPVREALFFPVQLTCTEELLSPGLRCCCPLPHTDSALLRLMRRLLGARSSLELCLFTFSSPPLARAVLLLHRRGVPVRVITDSDYMAASGSQIGALRREGIVVRHSQTSGFMHHKFAVIDKTILITGSMNWTMQAIQVNRENILITDDRACVTAYLEEFERLWEEYDPSTYDFFPEGLEATK